MNIIINKQVINKTWKYIVPILMVYGNDFMKMFNELAKIIIVIDDGDKPKSLDYTNALFIVINRNLTKDELLNKFFKLLVDKQIIITNYENYNKLVIVIKLPDVGGKHIIPIFKKGEYSKLYPPDIIDFLFEKKSKEYKVVTRNGKPPVKYLKKLNNKYNSSLTLKDISNHEYLLPPSLKNNSININSQQEYFNEFYDKPINNYNDDNQPKRGG